MKFIRPEQLKEMGITEVVRASAKVDTKNKVEEAVAVAPVVEEVVAPVVEEVPVVEVPAAEPVKEDVAKLEALKKRFAIPTFNRGKFERVTKPEAVAEKVDAVVDEKVDETATIVDEKVDAVVEPVKEERVPAEMLFKKVVEPVPVEAVVAPVEEPAPVVEEVVEAPVVEEVVKAAEPVDVVEPQVEVAVPVEDIQTEPDISSTTENLKEDESEVEPEEKSAANFELSAEAWEKFIDDVIVPTLDTCVDHLKNFIHSVLADDLKK